jgi:hypothetical protein
MSRPHRGATLFRPEEAPVNRRLAQRNAASGRSSTTGSGSPHPCRCHRYGALVEVSGLRRSQQGGRLIDGVQSPRTARTRRSSLSRRGDTVEGAS